MSARLDPVLEGKCYKGKLLGQLTKLEYGQQFKVVKFTQVGNSTVVM